MDISTLEDAIIAGIAAQFPALKTVARADTVEAESIGYPAIFIQTDSVRESQYATEEQTHYAVAMSALVVYRDNQKSECMSALAGYIDFINRNEWGGIVTGAQFTGAGRAQTAEPSKD